MSGSKPGSKAWMMEVMDAAFAECRALREAGQKEYAHRDENSFANFERVAERLGLRREQVLLTYMEKHLDGIHAYVQGHRSQRESVRGRINDAIVYLCLLRGMVEMDDAEGERKRKVLVKKQPPTAGTVIDECLERGCADSMTARSMFVGECPACKTLHLCCSLCLGVVAGEHGNGDCGGLVVRKERATS